MKENKLIIFLIIFFLVSLRLNAEIIILSKCDHKEDGFLKNEYILDLNELIMTRNYVYNEKLIKNIELQI